MSSSLFSIGSKPCIPDMALCLTAWRWISWRFFQGATGLSSCGFWFDVDHSADIEVCRKAIDIVLSMTSSRNIQEIVLFLKKQLQRTQAQEFEKVRFVP